MADIRMTLCILHISFAAGTLSMIIVFKQVSPMSLVNLFINIAAPYVFYKRELKKLYEKFFGDDDFRGGNFG